MVIKSNVSVHGTLKLENRNWKFGLHAFVLFFPISILISAWFPCSSVGTHMACIPTLEHGNEKIRVISGNYDFFRHCEERQRRSNLSAIPATAGLRFARND
jgi:hypothetical protein